MENVNDCRHNLKLTSPRENPRKPWLLQDLFNCENSTLETYFCKNCNFQTILTVILQEHSCTFYNNLPHCLRTYICKKCNFETHFGLKWLKHRTYCLTKHRTVNLRKIQFSSAQYSSLDQDTGNTTESSLDPLFKCEHCPFTTNQITSLTLHSHIKHRSLNLTPNTPQPLKLKCDKCPFVTPKKRLLHQHSTYVHAPQKWHRCDECTYKTRSSNNLNAHKKHHLESKNPKCHKCQTHHFDQKCVHDAEIQWLYCDQCPSRFKEKSWLKYHIHYEHVKKVWFECEQCPYKSNRNSKLIKHVVARHKRENDIKWHQCDHCDFKSKEVQGLRRHVVRRHTPEENIQWFKCDLCSYKTKQNGGLINHTIRKHLKAEEIQWFQCEDCPYKAKTKDYLRKHQVLRHVDKEDEEWFECEECGFRTNVKLYLRTHKKRRHSRKSELC